MREKMIAIIVFLSLILITPVTATAEIKFDVKTKLHEKRQLHLIKLAVVQFINESNWAKVKDFGEDYSLWLKNIKRGLNGELIIVELDVEIHGPAIISEGVFIVGRHLSITYDPSGAEKVNPDKADTLNAMVHEQLNSADLLSALVPFFLPVAGPIIGLPTAYVGTAVDVMISNLKEEKPSPGEILEATIVAAKVMVETKRMLQTPRGNTPSIK